MITCTLHQDYTMQFTVQIYIIHSVLLWFMKVMNTGTTLWGTVLSRHADKIHVTPQAVNTINSDIKDYHIYQP